MNAAKESQSCTNPKTNTRLLASETMRIYSFAEVRPRMISQDMRKRKDTIERKMMTKSKKNMTTRQVVIVKKGMRFRLINNLMTSKASL